MHTILKVVLSALLILPGPTIVTAFNHQRYQSRRQIVPIDIKGIRYNSLEYLGRYTQLNSAGAEGDSVGADSLPAPMKKGFGKVKEIVNAGKQVSTLFTPNFYRYRNS